MSSFICFAKNLMRSAFEAQTPILTTSYSSSSPPPRNRTNESERQVRRRKRQSEDIVPSIETDEPKSTAGGERARKRRISRRGDEDTEGAVAQLNLYERERRRREERSASGRGDSFKDALAAYALQTTSDDEEDGIDVEEAEGNIVAGEELTGMEDNADVTDSDEVGDSEEEPANGNETDEDLSLYTADNLESNFELDISLSNYGSDDRLPDSSPRSTIDHSPASRKRPDWHSPQSLAVEKERREVNLASQTVGWSTADSNLYRTLQLRGLQPLLSIDWLRDFPSLPLALFTEDSDKVVIKALHAYSVHGSHALNRLMGVGSHIRDRISHRCQGLPAEAYIKKAILGYFKWTLNDACILRRRAYLPLLTILGMSRDTDAMLLQRKLVKRMQKLKHRWAEALSENEDASVPPQYGIMVSHCVMAIVAPVSMAEFGEECLADDGGSNRMNDSVRILAMLDWSEKEQDVWIAFAIAILGVHCRDLLLANLEGRSLKGLKIVDDGDPDV